MLLYSEQCWPGESSLFLTAPIKKYARLLHIFQCDNFCRLLTNFQKERDMTALNKKWHRVWLRVL